MELDPIGPQINGLDVPPPSVMLEDSEPLPNVILGSEQWHGQVPEVIIKISFIVIISCVIHTLILVNSEKILQI